MYPRLLGEGQEPSLKRVQGRVDRNATAGTPGAVGKNEGPRDRFPRVDPTAPLRQRFLDRLADKLFDRIFETLPIRVRSVSFGAEGPHFVLDIENTTAEDIPIEKFLLKTSYSSENSWSQPIELRALRWDTASLSDMGLKAGTVPAFTRLFLPLGGRLVRDRVLTGAKLEIVGIRDGRVVFRHRTRTKWLRRWLLRSKVRTPEERRRSPPTHAPDGTAYAGHTVGIHPEDLDELEAAEFKR